jgi:hypothetical protein
LQESYQQLETILGSFLPEEQSWQIDQGKKTLNAMLGISIDDLIVALGRQLLIFEESSARGIMPAAVVAISGGNPQVIENSVIRLFPFLQILARSSGVSVSLRSHSVEIKDTKYKIGYIQTANLEAPITPAWTTYDGNLLMALHPTVLEQVLHRVTAEDREHFIIPDDFKHPLILCVRPAISYSFIDVEEVLRWSWPTLVPILQYGIGKNKLPIDTVAMPSAYLFKDWKLQNKSWIDEDGYRSTSNTPVPLGIDGFGGLIFDFIATTLERNGPRDVISEEEAEDPFAEDPVVEEALEKPETEKKPL